MKLAQFALLFLISFISAASIEDIETGDNSSTNTPIIREREISMIPFMTRFPPFSLVNVYHSRSEDELEKSLLPSNEPDNNDRCLLIKMYSCAAVFLFALLYLEIQIGLHHFHHDKH